MLNFKYSSYINNNKQYLRLKKTRSNLSPLSLNYSKVIFNIIVSVLTITAFLKAVLLISSEYLPKVFKGRVSKLKILAKTTQKGPMAHRQWSQDQTNSRLLKFSWSVRLNTDKTLFNSVKLQTDSSMLTLILDFINFKLITQIKSFGLNCSVYNSTTLGILLNYNL